MAEAAEISYNERIRRMNALKLELAQTRQSIRKERKLELERRKLVTDDPTAEGIIKKYAAWSLAAGVIPMPVVDLAALTGIQIRMLDQLAEQFGMNYSEHKARHTLHALMGGLAPSLVVCPVASMVKMIPFIGTLGGLLVSPAAAAASTYAVGQLFLEHFKNGGTLDDFDVEKAKPRLEALTKAGTEVEGETPEGGKKK